MSTIRMKKALVSATDKYCRECKKPYDTFEQLQRHYYRSHPTIKAIDLKGTYIEKQVKAERRQLRDDASGRAGMVTTESTYVKHAKDDDSKFHCIRCNKEFSKWSAPFHFTEFHGLSKAEFKHWDLCGDVHFIRNKREHMFRIRKSNRCDAIGSHDAGSEAIAQIGDIVVDATAAPSDDADLERLFEDEELGAIATDTADVSAARAQRAPAHRAMPHGGDVDDNALTHNDDLQILIRTVNKFCIAVATHGIGGGTHMPASHGGACVESHITASAMHASQVSGLTVREIKLHIYDDILEWKPDDKQIAADRIPWPKVFAGRNHKDLTAFKQRLNQLGKHDTDAVISGINMLTNCITSEAGDESLLEIIVNGYKQELLETLWSTTLMKDTKSYGIKIAQALSLLVDTFRITANRHGQHELATLLQLVIDDFLEPLSARNTQKKETQRKAKDAKIKMRIKNLPSPELMKTVCRDAIFILNMLVQHYKGNDSIPPNIRFIANTLMYGICQFNGFCGRSMEWELLDRQHVVEQRSINSPYVSCPKHKTIATMGVAGKWLFDATWRSVDLFLLLPWRTPYFFDPPRIVSDTVSCASMVKKFCKTLTPGKTIRTVTLARRRFARMSKDVEESRAIIARANLHGKDTARKIYEGEEEAEDCAIAGRITAEGFFTTMVEFPSDAELLEHAAAHNINEVLAPFMRNRSVSAKVFFRDAAARRMLHKLCAKKKKASANSKAKNSKPTTDSSHGVASDAAPQKKPPQASGGRRISTNADDDAHAAKKTKSANNATHTERTAKQTKDNDTQPEVDTKHDHVYDDDIPCAELFQLRTMRGGFPNGTGRACYCASLLQSIFYSINLYPYKMTHSETGEPLQPCDEACSWCIVMQTYLQSAAIHSAYDLEKNWMPVLNKLSVNAAPLTLTEESDPTELLTRMVADFRNCALLGGSERAAMRERVHAEFEVGLQSSLQYTYPCGHSSQHEEVHDEETIAHLILTPPDGATHLKLSEFLARPGGVLGDYEEAPADFKVDHVCTQCNLPATVMKKWTCRPKSSTLMIAVERYRVTQQDFTSPSGADAHDLMYEKTGVHIEPDDLVFHGATYSLRAIIQHIGARPTSGHYITFAKIGGGSKGIVMCDDSKCEEIDAFPTDAFTDCRLLVYTSAQGGSTVDKPSVPILIDESDDAALQIGCTGHVTTKLGRGMRFEPHAPLAHTLEQITTPPITDARVHADAVPVAIVNQPIDPEKIDDVANAGAMQPTLVESRTTTANVVGDVGNAGAVHVGQTEPRSAQEEFAEAGSADATKAAPTNLSNASSTLDASTHVEAAQAATMKQVEPTRAQEELAEAAHANTSRAEPSDPRIAASAINVMARVESDEAEPVPPIHAAQKRKRAPNISPEAAAWLSSEHDRLTGHTFSKVSRKDAFWGELHKRAIELKKIPPSYTEDGVISAVNRMKAKMVRDVD